MVGADICGFAKDTTEELCNRWIQLGSFYPFARDHSDKGTIRQELYLWESVTRSARKALGLRYRLLPYIYTLSFEAHTRGSPIARPLFFTFPEDPNTLGISTQFLLGKGVLVSPVLKQGASTVDAYFPKGTWYNLYNVSDSITVESGSYVSLLAPLDTINVHVYEGTILPMQEMGMTTREARRSPFSLVVALGVKMEAYGDLYVDNGEDLEMVIEHGKSSYIEFYADIVEGGVRVRSEVQMREYAIGEGWLLDNITVLGAISAVGSHDANSYKKLKAIRDKMSVDVSSSSSMKRIITDLGPEMDHNNSLDVVLVISNLALPIGKSIELVIPWEK